MSDNHLNTAFLISGSGTTLQAILDAIINGSLLGISPSVVISSKPDAGGIAIAQQQKIPTIIINPAAYDTRELFGRALLDVLKKYSIDLVSQNGWLPLTPESVVSFYRERIINQHPGPLDPGHPDFGGKGMWGKRVTCARIIYSWVTHKDYWTESTIHYVAKEYDLGGIISADRCDIPRPPVDVTLEGIQKNPSLLMNTTLEVQKKLFPIEYANVIKILQSFVNKDVPTFSRGKPLIESAHVEILIQAKQLARELFLHG